MHTFVKVVIASMSLTILGNNSTAVHAQTACEHFEVSLSQLRRQHLHVDISILNSRKLCFDNCSSGQIRAAQFWESAASGAADSIRHQLIEYANLTGSVTTIAIHGRANSIVRIARRVGAANCIRDTYLERDTDGYRLVNNSTLANFSEEAGYCGDAFVYFDNWLGTTYAVLWNQGESHRNIIAYRMSPSLDMEKVCAVRKKTVE
jgi:hypothetical protein